MDDNPLTTIPRAAWSSAAGSFADRPLEDIFRLDKRKLLSYACKKLQHLNQLAGRQKTGNARTKFAEAAFNMKNNRIQRIESMEQLLDQVLAAESHEQVASQLKRLHDYYFSSAWMEDYSADEAGRLPPDLKRGVLSQDTLYNLLTEWKASLDEGNDE